MQYNTGTVAVTNGDATVTGTGTLFLANVTAGSVFAITNSGVPYIVQSITDDTHLELTATYAGTSYSGLAYSITTSYTPVYGIPYPERGDVDTATTLKRAMLDIETQLQARQIIGKTTKAMADANQTLTTAEALKQVIECTGALTATRDVIVPLTAGGQGTVFANTTTNGVRVIGASGTGITIAVAKRAIVYADGTNVVRVTADT